MISIVWHLFVATMTIIGVLASVVLVIDCWPRWMKQLQERRFKLAIKYREFKIRRLVKNSELMMEALARLKELE